MDIPSVNDAGTPSDEAGAKRPNSTLIVDDSSSSSSSSSSVNSSFRDARRRVRARRMISPDTTAPLPTTLATPPRVLPTLHSDDASESLSTPTLGTSLSMNPSLTNRETHRNSFDMPNSNDNENRVRFNDVSLSSSSSTASSSSLAQPLSHCPPSASDLSWSLRGVNGSLPIIRLVFMNDLISLIFSFCTKKDIAQFSNCSLCLSYLPWMIQFLDVEQHDVRFAAFIMCVAEYEKLYSKWVSLSSTRIRFQVPSQEIQPPSSSCQRASSSSSLYSMPFNLPHTSSSLWSLRIRRFSDVCASELKVFKSCFVHFHFIQTFQSALLMAPEFRDVSCTHLPHSVKTLRDCRLVDVKKCPLPPTLEVMDDIVSFETIPAFPSGLRVLKLCIHRFDKKRTIPGYFPASLRELRLSAEFNQRLSPGLLPSGITALHFGRRGFAGSFNYPLHVNSLPPSLRILSLSVDFNSSIAIGALPHGLESLRFPPYHSEFNKPFAPGVLPATLRELLLSSKFNQPLPAGVLPTSLRSLTLPLYHGTYTHWQSFHLPALTSLTVCSSVMEIQLLRWMELSHELATSLREIRRQHSSYMKNIQLNRLHELYPDVAVFKIKLFWQIENGDVEEFKESPREERPENENLIAGPLPEDEDFLIYDQPR